MTIQWLLAIHILVVGYWLGAELVINSSFRYVCYKTDMAFLERNRLMDHVMDVDQHVRYALVIQTFLGLMIALRIGYIPGGQSIFVAVLIIGLIWLSFVELVHRVRHQAYGNKLARIDRGLRYLLMAALILVAMGVIGDHWPMPGWLRWKLLLFACVIACGVAIRFFLIKFFTTWRMMEQQGPDENSNSVIKQIYVRATSILVLLWIFIIGMTALSITKY